MVCNNHWSSFAFHDLVRISMLLAAVAQFSAERIFDSKVRICENKPANGGGMSTKNSSHQEKDLMREKSLSRLLPSADPSSVSNGAMSFNAVCDCSEESVDPSIQFYGLRGSFLFATMEANNGNSGCYIFVALVSFKYDQFLNLIKVHVKNENPPREPDFEACADFSASFQAKLLGHTGNPYHLAIMNGGPNLSPAC
ncbi:hypothetical protein D5086_023861 [Populus alba]|uniref:Uncharacterized protein n=1 Tax=Populus alba TaxID=43335 RepID=A0ACC4BB45_POPAL